MLVTKKRFENLSAFVRNCTGAHDRRIELMERRILSLENDIEMMKKYLNVEYQYIPAKSGFVQKTSEQSEEPQNVPSIGKL